MGGSRTPRLALAALALLVVVGGLANGRGYRDFVFEDAFISYRYADNLARGQGFVFNPGERVLGTSTPLYTLALAALQAGVGLDPPRASALLFSVGLALIALIGGVLLRAQGHPIAAVLFAALVVSGWGGIRDVFGLETTCYAALLLASYWAATRARYATAGVLGGLSFLARHDGVLFVAALFAAATWRQRRPAWRLALAAGLTVAPWLLFAQLYFGSIFPNTLAAKLGTTSFRAYAPAALAIQAEHALRFLQPSEPGGGAIRLAPALAALLGAAGLAGALRLLARDRLSSCLLAFPVALWIGYSMIGPPIEHHWYLLPGSYFALLFCIAAGSIALRENPLARSPRIARLAPWLSGLVAAGALLLALRLPSLIEREYERETSTGFYRGRTTVYREMAGFLLDTDLARRTLMTAEPGYLAYLSGSPVIDAAGLVTRDIFLHASPD
ncbi:MAG TPA: hypothetical protein VEC18_07985, partial [Myxococcota bacterium]|nr:hypothetical protein [Myxococcota bacterium]